MSTERAIPITLMTPAKEVVTLRGHRYDRQMIVLWLALWILADPLQGFWRSALRLPGTRESKGSGGRCPRDGGVLLKQDGGRLRCTKCGRQTEAGDARRRKP